MGPAEWIWKCNMADQKAPESPKPNIAKRQQRPHSIALGYDPEPLGSGLPGPSPQLRPGSRQGFGGLVECRLQRR